MPHGDQVEGARIAPSMCRNCSAFCPILVTFENGRPVKVVGDPDGPYGGYTCPKGRTLPDQYNDPGRLLSSLRRDPDGAFRHIASNDAIEEVAEKLQDLIARYGPRSVAIYYGSGVLSTFFGVTMGAFFLKAIGSPMMFTASSIDKPAEKVSLALHGNWSAGTQSFASSDSWMIVGANPVIAKSNGAPYHNPGMRLKNAVNDGMKLIVIDPRETETAKRAYIHLQAKPGEDPTILAGIINIIIAEGLYDPGFVRENAVGFEVLKEATASFTPDYVAARADVPVADLLAAARTFAGAKRGSVSCSTGPSFSTHSNVAFYLGLCINTLCGRWARVGDKATYPNVLLPAYTPRAQPLAPWSPYGANVMLATGARESVAGMPAALLADEILYDGEDRVRALISIGGNPMSAFPDQRKTEAALARLDLLVQMDVTMSATARVADYVIASPMAFEAPSTTYIVESLKYLGAGRGLEMPWAQYSPALVDPPSGSDVVSEHAFLFRLAQKMGLQLSWTNYHGLGKHLESPLRTGDFDMSREPTLDEMWEMLTVDARVPLARVKQYPHGNLFDIDVTVEARDRDNVDMLQLGDPMMMAELAGIRAEDALEASGDYPFRLVSRRLNHVMNSQLTDLPGLSTRKPYNPLFTHPTDLAELGVADGEVVRLRSRAGEVLAVVEADRSLRRGVVSMSHGFGFASRTGDTDPRSTGANVNVLIPLDEADPISGIPRMSAVPVTIERLA